MPSVHARLRYVAHVKHRSSVVLSFLTSLLAMGCGEGSPGSVTSALRFDPCHPLVPPLLDPGAPSTTADREAGVQAVDLWNGIAGARLSVTWAATAPPLDPDTAPPTVPLKFQTAAALSHGFYDPVRGQVLVNDDLVAGPLAVTIAHEVGHAFGLVHVSNRPSVMNPGNLLIEPTAADAAALSDLWGWCDGAPPNEPN